MPIIQYWDTGTPPDYVADLMATFRDRNPGMSHRVFDEPSAEEFIDARFGEREVAAFRSCAVPAMQADYFRYCAVLALGGVYADAGFRCLRPLQPLIEAAAAGLLFRRDPPGYLLNGFFLFTVPGHPLLRLALDVATTNIERRAVEMVQMVTGPWIFSGLSLLHELDSADPSRQGAAGDGIAELEEPFRRRATAAVPTRAGLKGIDRMVEPLFEVVGDRARLARAFEGVRVAPIDEMGECVRESGEQLPYRQGDAYWINWQRRGRTIFR